MACVQRSIFFPFLTLALVSCGQAGFHKVEFQPISNSHASEIKDNQNEHHHTFANDNESDIDHTSIGTSTIQKIPQTVIAQDKTIEGGCTFIKRAHHKTECGPQAHQIECGNILMKHFRTEIDSSHNIKFGGNAAKWILSISNSTGAGNTKMPVKMYDAHNLERTNDGGYILPLQSLVTKGNDWSPAGDAFASDLKVTLRSATADGVVFGRECSVTFQLISPLVLDFSTSQGSLETLSASKSQVSFDLDRDGVKTQTGWILPTSSFLAYDRNQNGIIDHGGELFGNHTQTSNSNTTFENGFDALKTFDSNFDNIIDSSDAMFSKLLLWTDHNMDGISQKSELEFLADREVSKISLTYSTNFISSNLLFDNVIPFSAKFWGPKFCGEKGCNIHDVFFSTSSSSN